MTSAGIRLQKPYIVIFEECLLLICYLKEVIL